MCSPLLYNSTYWFYEMVQGKTPTPLTSWNQRDHIGTQMKGATCFLHRHPCPMHTWKAQGTADPKYSCSSLILQMHWKIYLQLSNRQNFGRDSRKTVVGPPSFSILSRSGQKFQQETATGRSCWFLEWSPGHGRSVVNRSCLPPWHMRTSPAGVLRNPELAVAPELKKI